MNWQQKIKTGLGAVIVWCLLINPPSVSAHGDEIEVNEGGTAGPVQLTKEQTQMLGIKVGEATLRPMAELLTLNGQIQLLPNAQADVSVRICHFQKTMTMKTTYLGKIRLY